MYGKNIFIKIYILISLLCYNKDIYNIINIFIKSIKIDFEIYKIKSFLKFCSKQNNNVKKFKKRNNPTISIISPIYNREKSLKRFLKSLQYQNFKDFEIILV
jgi:cellulose synthase/poly-beta-1,6-N-acetylglucosamine synthase-like glycosyltransferase